MSEQRLPIRRAETHTEGQNGHRRLSGGSAALGARRAPRPVTQEEVAEQYLAARDAWVSAMRAAQSGKAADLAALAMAQDRYEAALAVKQRWDAAPRATIPIGPDRPRSVDAIVTQELARRRVQEHHHELEEARPGGLRGFFRRLRRR